MTTTINSYASSSALAQNGVDVITFDTTGITAGLSDALALTKTKTSLNATGSAPIYACRAWVNFNGTGTVAIRASGNVSSITDNGTGDYTANFIDAMPDGNYVLAGGAGGISTQQASVCPNYSVALPTASAVRFQVTTPANVIDLAYVNLEIFR